MVDVVAKRCITFVVVAVIAVCACIPATATAAENELHVYGLPGTYFEITFPRSSFVISHTFGDDATLYSNPFIVDVQSIYAEGASSITITTSVQTITAVSVDRVPLSVSGTYVHFSDTPLQLITQLLAWKNLYLLPYGYIPDYAGITPTPFVNSGNVVPDTGAVQSLIDTISPFKKFVEFMFVNVIPWAGVLSVVMLVFVVLRFMLRG